MMSLEMLKLKLGITDRGQEDLLNLLLSDAEEAICDRIGRDILPERLRSAAVDIAVIAFNRLGTEGESNRSEGGWSSGYLDELPAPILQRIKNYPRKVRVMRDG